MPVRSSRRSSAAKRQGIIDATRDVISSQGYRETSTRDIAAAVGTGHGAVRRMFASKHDAYISTLDTDLERLTGTMPQARPASTRWSPPSAP